MASFGKEQSEAVLADYRTAPIGEGLRATLALLEKATQTPDAVGKSDVQAALHTGISAEAVRDALWVMYLFNVYDRLADTLFWEVPSAAGLSKMAQRLLRSGYGG